MILLYPENHTSQLLAVLPGKEKWNEMKLPGGKAATREYVKHRGAISEMFKKY